ANRLKETELRVADTDSKKMDKNTTDIGINQINKNKGLIDETYLTDGLKAQIAGDAPIHSVPKDKSITNIKLANDSVEMENLSFANKTENLFNGYQRGIIDISGDWTYKELEDSKGVVAIVLVENNSTYHVRLFDNSDRFRIIGTKEYPTNGIDANTGYGNDATQRKRTINDTYDNNYLVIQVSNSGERPRLQVTKYVDRLSYIPPRIISGHYLDVNVPEKSVGDKELIEDSIGIGKLSFADKTNNVFTKYERGIIDTSDNWKVKDSEDNKGVITIVPVENNSTYIIRLFDESDRLRVIGTKELPEKGIEGDTAYGNVNESSIRTINDTYENNYLVIQVSNSGETPRIQITKDESSLNYTPNRQIDGYYLKDDSFGIDKLSFTTKSVNLFN